MAPIDVEGVAVALPRWVLAAWPSLVSAEAAAEQEVSEPPQAASQEAFATEPLLVFCVALAVVAAVVVLAY